MYFLGIDIVIGRLIVVEGVLVGVLLCSLWMVFLSILR